MPPKTNPKEPVKKTTNIMKMLPVSEASLFIVPEFATEGWQDRLYQCVDWSLNGNALRHHLKQCRRKDIPQVSFSEGFQNKLNNSILHYFLDRKSKLTLQDHYDLTLAMNIGDQNVAKTEEAKICYSNVNNIIDDYMPIIKNAVKHNDRSIIERGLLEAPLLRLNDCKITHLDENLTKYRLLATLVLCGNYISEINGEYLPPGLRALEMQANRVSELDSFTYLPNNVLYLGLSKNLLNNDGISALSRLPRQLTCLDLSDNDIYDLEPLLKKLERLPLLKGLYLAGNPCAMSAGYAVTTVSRLPRLKYLDNREILPTDRMLDDFEIQGDDLRANYFFFNIVRIISPPVPPKVEKGTTSFFHVEFELPLLDSMRRNFLMTRQFESLTELLPYPMPEEDELHSESVTVPSVISNINAEQDIESEQDTDIFSKMKPVNPNILRNYTIFESPKFAWSKMVNLPEPTIKIFCPDLTALRDTFRSTITLRLVYSEVMAAKKPDKKSAPVIKQTEELRVTIATIKCSLQNVDWSQPHQYFHWDESLGTEEAIHWGDGDLHLVNYQTQAPKEKKPTKGPAPVEEIRITPPEHLTCHFGFGIYSIQA